MTEARLTRPGRPGTKAGRELLADASRFGTDEEVRLLRAHLVPMILAVEKEAIEEGMRRHSEDDRPTRIDPRRLTRALKAMVTGADWKGTSTIEEYAAEIVAAYEGQP